MRFSGDACDAAADRAKRQDLTTHAGRGQCAEQRQEQERKQVFDQERANEVCEQISQGKSLRQIRASSPDMPAPSTVVLWASQSPPFAEQYARAMMCRTDLAVDRLADIAEQVLDGTLAPDQARVAADLIKWPASKLNAKKYGDRIQSEVDMTIRVQVEDPTARAVIVAQQSLPPTDDLLRNGK